MNPILFQKQLRDNANDLQEFCKDLQNWGEEMKRKEGAFTNLEDKSARTNSVKSNFKRVKKVRINEPVVKSKSITDYNAWEKFDAEAECGKIDDEDFEESELTDECDETKRDEALVYKEKGNRLVKNQKWMEATVCYTKAIECYAYDPVYYANRALCYLKVNQMQKAVEDCTLSLKLDPSYVKAYQRRAAAREALNDLESAQYDLQQVLVHEPNNKETKTTLMRVNKKIEDILKLEKSSRPVSKFTTTRSQVTQVKPIPKLQNDSSTTTISSTNALNNTKQRSNSYRNDVFWPSGDDVIVVKATRKPPHLQSKKPLKRVQIIDVDSSNKLEGSEPKCLIENEPVAVKDHVIERVEPTSVKHDVITSEQSNKPSKQVDEVESTKSAFSTSDVPFPNVYNNVFSLKTDKLQVKEKVTETQKSSEEKSIAQIINKEVSEDVITKVIETKPPNIVSSEVNKALKNFDNDVRKLNPSIQNSKELFSEPKTSVQFYNCWKQLQDTNLKYMYLSRYIDPEILPKIFKESLDSDTFSEFIKILACHYISNKDQLYQFLYYLTKVQRFSALTLFMSTEDKNNIWKIIDHLKQDENVATGKVDELIVAYEL